MLTIAYILLSFQLMALATPVDRERKDGNRILLTKRAPTPDQVGDGLADIERLVPLPIFAWNKYANGFKAYRKNTGEPHPLSVGFGGPASNLTRRATGMDPLSDENDGLFWKGSIFAGTPPQEYTVDFDTGSSDLFLPGPGCDSTCDGHRIYDPSKSSTSADRHQSYTLTYGDGSSVSGEQYTDIVSIAGLTATDQALGASSSYSSGFTSPRFTADGLLGMGYQSISEYNSPPPFQTLLAQNQTTQPVFAFKLATTGSELFLGGVNTDLFTGNFTYAPVVDQGYWQVPMDAISVNGAAAASNLQAVIDTGTTLIIGDAFSVFAFYASIPGSKDASWVVGPGFYTFPCDAVLKISMTFGGSAFPIRLDLFNLGKVKPGSNDCIGAIVGQNQRFWIVGDVFLQNVYSKFDFGNNRVGFATLK